MAYYPPTRPLAMKTVVATVATLLASAGCQEGPARDITVEVLPQVEPSLPAVPTLPPPPHPVRYEDGSYSVYGLRARMEATVGQSHEVTGYVVKIYEPPPCPSDEPCAAPPHFFIADLADETDVPSMLRVVGYATRHDDVERAMSQHARGRYRRPEEGSPELPIPVELAPGLQMKIQGQFNRVSSTGFSDSGGLLDFRDYQLVAPSPS